MLNSIRILPAVCVCLLGLLTGCASTKVVKDPGQHDCGFRFYRSKPYLKISPDSAASPNFYKVELAYLPDFTEEYSAHIFAGVGTNNTTLTLDNSGVLQSVNVTVDSKASDVMNSANTLLGTAAGLLRPGAAGGAGADSKTSSVMQVVGIDVPIGYYEAVISRDTDGKKKLYGWRYVGFMPQASCPVEMAGSEKHCCNEAELYGLVSVGNVMMFRRISDIATSPRTVTAVKAEQQATVPPVKKEGQ